MRTLRLLNKLMEALYSFSIKPCDPYFSFYVEPPFKCLTWHTVFHATMAHDGATKLDFWAIITFNTHSKNLKNTKEFYNLL